MADNVYGYDVLEGEPPPSETQSRGTLGDFAKTVGAGVVGTGEDLSAAAQHFYEVGGGGGGADISRGFRKIFGSTKDDIEESINPETRKLAAAAMTSPEFWEHPVLASALKLSGMAPAVAAMAIPGGLLADTVAATMAASAAGGVINAGSGLSEFYKQLDKMPDEDLQKQSELYRQIREDHDEGDARRLFARQAQGWAPAINALIGAGVGAIGPAGTAARSLAGGAEQAVLGAGERGALGAAGVGGLEGGVGGAVQGGATDIVNQQANVRAGLQKDVDYGQAGASALESGALGGVAGGALGGLLHRGARAAPAGAIADDVAEAGTVAPAGATGTSPVAGKAAPAQPSPTVPAKAPHELEGTLTQPKEAGTTGTATQPVGTGAAEATTTADTALPAGEAAATARPAPGATKVEVTGSTGLDAATKAALDAAAPAKAIGGIDMAQIQRGIEAAQQAVLPGRQPPPAVPPVAAAAPAAAAPAAPPASQTAPVAQRGAGVTPQVTGEPTVPEAPASFPAQTAQAQAPAPPSAEPSAVRKGVLYPAGTAAPAKPAGMNSVKIPEVGVIHYDPGKITRYKVQQAAKQGKLNEVLGLGPVDKGEALGRIAQGEGPVAVTERTPAGTEVKAAAGTTETAPAQVAALESAKAPENTVAVETPANVIQMRGAGESRGDFIKRQNADRAAAAKARVEAADKVLKAKQAEEVARIEAEKAKRAQAKPDLTKIDETAPIASAENIKAAEKAQQRQEEGGPGANLRGKKGVEVRDQIAKAEDVVARHEPQAIEADHFADAASEGAVIARAQRMLDDAKAAGVKIPEQIKPSVKGNTPSDSPAVVILREAQDLINTVGRSGTSGPDRIAAVHKFWERDGSIRKGALKEVIGERRAEGEAKMRRGTGEDVEPGSKAGRAVQLDAGTEGVGKETRAKAASGDKLAADAERKAKLIAEMNEKLGLKPPTKNNTRKSEALVVDPNPTEAQKVAGNYKKGHRTVEGIRLTLENLKGGIRRGIDALGEKWQARMGADYGYIKKTRGADGDQIDAYDGKRGKKHFILDQLDADTGAFDEHKVMLRFKDEAAARKAYEDSFSDGKGAQRIGAIHEVSADELKTWLKSGDTERPHVEHLIDRDLSDANFDVKGPRRQPQRAADVLGKMDFSSLGGVNKVLAPFIKSRLLKMAGDVEVHRVSPSEMAQLSPAEPRAVGLHVRDFNPNVPSKIYVLDSVKNGMGHGELGHVVMHELAHAVTVREMEANPQFEAVINKMRLTMQEHYLHNYDELVQEFPGQLKYGQSDNKEFIAEAFSNSAFQEVLARVPLDERTARQLGLRGERPASMWDYFRNMVKRAVEKVTGRVQNFDTLLDGVMRAGEQLTDVHEKYTAPSIREYADKRARVEEVRRRARMESDLGGQMRSEAFKATEDVTRQVTDLLERDRGPRGMALRTFDNIAQAADRYFGENNPVRKIQSAIEATRVSADKFYAQSGPMMKTLVELRGKFPDKFKEFSSLLHDATVANVRPEVDLTHAGNAHLGKNDLKGVWSKGQYKDLSMRYDKLIEEHPEFRKAWSDVTNHFRNTQNEMSLGIMKNQVLKLFGHDDEALAERIHEGSLSDLDKARLGDNLGVIEAAGELSKINGTYVPLMRRGDHVVKGEVKLTKPANAKQIDSNTFEFGTRKEAEDYAKNSDLQTSVKKVWVDENTGEIHQADPDTGEPHRMRSTDADATAVYRATVQNQHVEFVQGRGAAEKRAKQLRDAGGMDVHKVVPRQYEPSGRAAGDLSKSLQSLLNKLQNSEAYKQATSTQQAAIRASIQEAALASHGSTRVSSRALPRRGVRGYSEDLVQNTSDYNTSAGRYLAKLEHAPQLEQGMKDMHAAIRQDASKEGQYGRTTIANEVNKRVAGDNGFEQGGGKISGVTKRLMAVSFMDKLASPAYSLINATQPAMVTMPYLAGRHGLLRSAAALGRAYSDLSALHIFKQGVKETGRRLKGSSQPDDFISDAKARLKSPGERAMIDELLRTGEVDPSSGMEIHSLIKDRSGILGKLDTGLGYLEGVTREMPRAVEAVNRMTSALAAYRLEVSRGVPHEKAVQFAKDTVNNTQFNYSPTNAPAIFNHPIAKVALQFKKYGQGMYQLIGSEIGKAYRNESPGDRAQAVKTLITLAATHMAMAGALGLPTEPFKYLVMGANAAGLTSTTWGDVENKIRTEAARMMGPTAGEALTRGLPRLFNMDLGRMGLDSITSFGEPRSLKEADVKTWLWDNAAGPVAALGTDYVKAIHKLSNGDLPGFLENTVPIKAFSDSLRAYRQAGEGKKSPAGRETLSAYTPGETAMRVLGFGSGREAETGAARSAYYSASGQQKQEHTDLVNNWAQAKGSDKTKAMAAITKWNKDRPEEAQIKPKDLTNKIKADQKAKREGVLGIVASKRDKYLIPEGIYNTGR